MSAVELHAYRTHRLRLVGELRLPARFLAEYRGVFEHVPRLPRQALKREYARAQAFLFNAMADGFGHVLTEAMASGTPVLASRNSGAPDLVVPGEHGWLFEYGDDEALACALDKALGSPALLRRMGQSAQCRALSWTSEQFAVAFLKWIRPLLERTPRPAVPVYQNASW